MSKRQRRDHRVRPYFCRCPYYIGYDKVQPHDHFEPTCMTCGERITLVIGHYGKLGVIDEHWRHWRRS